MKIGRRIYYDIPKGNVLYDGGLKSFGVKETTPEEDIQNLKTLEGIDPATIGYIDLPYGKREKEIQNKGSYEVVNGELIIYPRLVLSSDKDTILNDGVDFATLTATVEDTMNVYTIDFFVGGTAYQVDTVNGIATFEFASNVVGVYTIEARNPKYGKSIVNVEVVDSAETAV